MSSIEQLIEEIGKLPRDWHTVGSINPQILRAIVKHTRDYKVYHSVETGCGKSTLFFSHFSKDHRVFSKDRGNSMSVVRTSTLFNNSTVEFIEGPTQLTLPKYQFEHELQVALMDGPHGYPFPEIEYWCLYPHIEKDGLLIVDDIRIPTIYHLFSFLKEEEMFTLVEVVQEKTAFFRRTDKPLFDPYGDGWWLQNYNKNRNPITSFRWKVKSKIPSPVRSIVKLLLGRR